MRILGIDPGQKNIGIAISDATGTIANPLSVIRHVSKAENAKQIARLARENEVKQIVIGQSLDWEGNPTIEGRRAAKLANAIKAIYAIPIVMWDESFSTQKAREAKEMLGVSLKKRRSHSDELAATVILQSYLDSQPADPDHIS